MLSKLADRMFNGGDRNKTPGETSYYFLKSSALCFCALLVLRLFSGSDRDWFTYFLRATYLPWTLVWVFATARETSYRLGKQLLELHDKCPADNSNEDFPKDLREYCSPWSVIAMISWFVVEQFPSLGLIYCFQQHLTYWWDPIVYTIAFKVEFDLFKDLCSREDNFRWFDGGKFREYQLTATLGLILLVCAICAKMGA